MRHCLATAVLILSLPTGGAAQEPVFGDAEAGAATRYSTIDRSAFPVSSPSDYEEFPPLEADAVGSADGTGPIQPVSKGPEIDRIPEPQGPVAPEPVPPSLQVPGQPWIQPTGSRFSATLLPAGDDDIGLFDFDIRGKFALPSVEGLTVTPGFQVHLVDGPTRTDLPEELYNLRAEFRYKRHISRPVWFEVAATPGIYTDFEHGDSDAFRIILQGLGFFAFSYQTQAVFGLTFLDRHDIDFLPVVGIIHSPNPDTRLNLVFPAPKLSYRFRQNGHSELWGYIAGEFGGGSWAISRPARAFLFPPGLALGRRGRPIRVPPAVDEVSYTDWRLIFGVEQKQAAGRTLFLEAAWVFNRELDYDSGIGDFDPDSTAMLRAGVNY